MRAYRVDRKKWAALDLFEQMGNIGSEVGRSLGAKRKGDEKTAEAAAGRALDLFDATTEAWLHAASAARVRELLRAKEQYLNSYYDSSAENGIENYFMQFAVAARLRR